MEEDHRVQPALDDGGGHLEVAALVVGSQDVDVQRKFGERSGRVLRGEEAEASEDVPVAADESRQRFLLGIVCDET